MKAFLIETLHTSLKNMHRFFFITLLSTLNLCACNDYEFANLKQYLRDVNHSFEQATHIHHDIVTISNSCIQDCTTEETLRDNKTEFKNQKTKFETNLPNIIAMINNIPTTARQNFPYPLQRMEQKKFEKLIDAIYNKIKTDQASFTSRVMHGKIKEFYKQDTNNMLATVESWHQEHGQHSQLEEIEINNIFCKKAKT